MLLNETQKRRSKVCGKSELKSLNVFELKRQKSDRKKKPEIENQKLKPENETGYVALSGLRKKTSCNSGFALLLVFLDFYSIFHEKLLS